MGPHSTDFRGLMEYCEKVRRLLIRRFRQISVVCHALFAPDGVSSRRGAHQASEKNIATFAKWPFYSGVPRIFSARTRSSKMSHERENPTYCFVAVEDRQFPPPGPRCRASHLCAAKQSRVSSSDAEVFRLCHRGLALEPKTMRNLYVNTPLFGFSFGYPARSVASPPLASQARSFPARADNPRVRAASRLVPT